MVVSGVYTQDNLLSKEDALDMVLENNLQIKVAHNLRKVDENNASVYNSGYLPTLSGLAGGNIDRQTTEGELANGDVRKATGAETRRYNASINLDYILFDGLGRYYDYKRFQERSKQSELEVRQTIELTILQLFSVYYEVARLTENVENLKQALAISNDRLKRAQYQFEFGQNTGLDVLNAEVDINTDSINLLNVEQLLRNTKRDLNLIFNRDLDASFVADTNVVFVPKMSMEKLILEAKQKNVEMLLMEQDILISEYSWKASRRGYLPTIGLTGSYGWNELSNNSPLAFLLQNTSSGVTGGINLTWNLFDGGRSYVAVQNAKIGYENQALMKKQTELEVERDIENAWDSYKNALIVLEVQEKNLQTNLNNFNRTDERYRLGQVTSVEFRQAQLNRLNAELVRSQAKYTAKLAELQMLQVGGELLNTNF